DLLAGVQRLLLPVEGQVQWDERPADGGRVGVEAEGLLVGPQRLGQAVALLVLGAQAVQALSLPAVELALAQRPKGTLRQVGLLLGGRGAGEEEAGHEGRDGGKRKGHGSTSPPATKGQVRRSGRGGGFYFKG